MRSSASSQPTKTRRQKRSNKQPTQAQTQAQTQALTEVSAADVEGAIFCPHLAHQLTGLPVEMDFPGHGTFAGSVTGSEPVAEFGGAFLHTVRFSDGDVDEYSYQKILIAHERYLSNHSPAGSMSHVSLRPHTLANPGGSVPPRPSEEHASSSAGNPQPTASLQLPASYQDYPIRVPIEGTIVQAQIVERRVDEAGLHQWRLLLPAPFSDRETWVDTQTLHRSFDEARRRNKIAAPTKKTPTVTPLLDFAPPFAENHRWTTNHPFVGLVTTAYLSSTVPVATQGPSTTETADQKNLTASRSQQFISPTRQKLRPERNPSSGPVCTRTSDFLPFSWTQPP